VLSLSRIAHSRNCNACSRKLIDGIRELTGSDMAICNSHSSNSIISYPLYQNLPTHSFTSTPHSPPPTSSPLSAFRSPLSPLSSTHNQPPPPPKIPTPISTPSPSSLLSPPTLPHIHHPPHHLTTSPPHKPHQPRKFHIHISLGRGIRSWDKKKTRDNHL